MVNQGLINEVKKLIKYKHLNSLNTIGYKEIFRYLNGDISLEFAVNEIKKNSRRFAKRQITWFKSNNNIIWFNQNYKIDNIIKVIDELISN
jgi:tRNA dimethylallyltransferase